MHYMDMWWPYSVAWVKLGSHLFQAILFQRELAILYVLDLDIFKSEMIHKKHTIGNSAHTRDSNSSLEV